MQDVVLDLAIDTTPGSVSGRLAFDPEATGPGDARVRLVSTEGTSVDTMIAADNTFRADSVPVGLYRITATRSGYSQLEVINVLIVSGLEAKIGTLTLTTAPAFDAGPPPTYDASVPFDAGTDAGVDAGLDAGTDAGTMMDAGAPLCSGPADCMMGQWCDPRFGRCLPLCLNDQECGFNRVCDTPTGSCVNSCMGACPAGQICNSSNVCQAVCSGAFPCPAGKRCAMGMCVNECDPMISNSCNSPFLSCDMGACKRNAYCTGDLDCAPSQLCVNNQCGARPTDAGVLPDGGTSADGGLFFACSIPCQCRVGEQCADGFCVPDIVPTYFVALDGGGNGLSASSPSSVLFVGDAGVLALRANPDGGPGIVALLREDTWDLQSRTLRIVNGSEVAGGFTNCGDGRWIRDRAHRTPVTGEGGDSSNPPTGLMMFDTSFNAVNKGTVSGLAFTLTGIRTCGGAAFTVRSTGTARSDGIHLHDLDGTISMGACSSPTLVVRAVGMRNGLLQRIRLLGLTSTTAIQGGALSFDDSSATVEDIDVAPVSSLGSIAIAIDVSTTPEPFVLRRIHIGRFASTDPASRGIWIRRGPNAPVTIEDVDIQWFISRTAAAGGFSGVTIEGSGSVDLKRILVDGTAHPGPVPFTTKGIELINNGGGTLRDIEVRLPPNSTQVDLVDGLYLNGSIGYDIQNLTVTGTGVVSNGSSTTSGVRFSVATTGSATTLRNANISIQGRRPVGVFAQASGTTVPISVLDSRIDVRGDGACMTEARGVYLEGLNGNTARLRVERTQISATNSALVMGAHVLGNSQLDLFASTLKLGSSYGIGGTCGGAMSQSGNLGVALSGTGPPRLISRANTIDSGGVQGQAAQSTAIWCDNNTAQLISLESSVLTAGIGNPSRFIASYNTTSIPLCSASPAAAANYFFRYPLANPTPAAGEALFDGGMLLGGGNNYGTTSCFAPATPLADGGFGNAFIPNGAPCLNGGFITQRADGTPVLLDVFGQPRDGGNGLPDIGAIEAP